MHVSCGAIVGVIIEVGVIVEVGVGSTISELICSSIIEDDSLSLPHERFDMLIGLLEND